MKKKEEKKVVAIEAPKKVEFINIFKTSYFYWRFWVKEILITGKINKARFVRNEVGYSGNIAVQKTEVDAAKKVLADYKVKKPDTVDMWH